MTKTQVLSASRAGLASVIVGDSASGKTRLISNVDVVTASPATVATETALHVDAETFYAPALIVDKLLQPAVFSDGDAFYAPAVTAPANLVPRSLSTPTRSLHPPSPEPDSRRSMSGPTWSPTPIPSSLTSARNSRGCSLSKRAGNW